MKNRITVVLNDEEYYLIKGKWYDTHLIEAPQGIANALADQMLKSNIDDFTNEDLEKFVMGFKDQGLTSQALQIADILYDRYVKASDMYKIRWLLPIMTSLLRMAHTPLRAIELFTAQTEKFGNAANSPQLLTSIAAAYCDVGDYVNAKRMCDWAYKWGGSAYELDRVYDRVKYALGQ